MSGDFSPRGSVAVPGVALARAVTITVIHSGAQAWRDANCDNTACRPRRNCDGDGMLS